MPVGWLKELKSGEYVIIRMRSVKHEIDMLLPCVVVQNTPDFLVMKEANGERSFRFDSRNALVEIGKDDDSIVCSLSIHKADSETVDLAEGAVGAKEKYDKLVEQLDTARDIHVGASKRLREHMASCLKKEEDERTRL